MSKPTAIVYVDALNLYYGSLRGTKYKWLNLETLFDRLLPGYEILTIFFFTADLKGSLRPDNPGAPNRQKAYFRALGSLKRVIVVKGSFTKVPAHFYLRFAGDGVLSNFLKSRLKLTKASVWKIEEKAQTSLWALT